MNNIKPQGNDSLPNDHTTAYFVARERKELIHASFLLLERCQHYEDP